MRPPTNRAHDRAAGFTLAELLVVIAIIALLVGMLTPSLQNVRRQAKVASSQATFSAIETGLASLRADANIGGAYPPSRPDQAAGIQKPFAGCGFAVLRDVDGLSGAALLVMALAGADLQGAPGFRDLDGDGYWADNCCGGITGAGGTYATVAGGVTPYHQRFGPFVDIEKMRITPKVRGTPVTNPDFELAASKSAVLKLPVFLDAFGFPVLYWRADPSGQEAVEDGGTPVPGIYRLDDNQFYTGNTSPLAGGTYNGVDLGAGTGHKIKNPMPSGGLPDDPSFWDPPNSGPRDNFAYFIHDPKVSVNLVPKKRDSFLLVSPGADALYGTGDDVANFAPNR